METRDKESPEPSFWTPGLESSRQVARLIDLALEEDMATGDITTDTVAPPGQTGKARIMAKETLVAAGMDVARMVFAALDPGVSFTVVSPDGARVEAGQVMATLEGRLRSLLWGERTALNFLQRLSGIATNTRAYMDAARDLPIRLTDTRKTTPGWRLLEKYAVRVGGASNHRMGLFDGILIKDNHIAAAGGIARAVTRARRGASHLLRVEVETSNMDEVRQALDAGADIIMLDNMNSGQIKEAAAFIAGRALVEVSGGVNRERLRDLAQAGVDILSCGALTHAARSMDISMKIESHLQSE